MAAGGAASGGGFHPRLSLNGICSMSQTFDADLALWEQLGVDHVGVITPKVEAVGWDAARHALAERGLRVSNVSCYKQGLPGSVEFTAAVGADVLYMVVGSGGTLTWEEAAEQFSAEMAPWVALGDAHGVRLAIEPTNPLRTDVSFVHTLRDAVDLARMAGTGVVLDFYSTWYERGLADLVRKNIELIRLVQINDFKLGTFDTPNRVAVGDGDIPVERLLALVLDAGYQGVFDLELLGPRIEEEGYAPPIVRSLERASEMLAQLGA
jgi:sugar phosphate isomerase/epimerase